MKSAIALADPSVCATAFMAIDNHCPLE